MQSTRTEKAKPLSKKQKMISGILVSALDMEDEIAHSVYLDYMDRNNWPAGLKNETFEEIRDYLTTLLDDTQRHRNIIKNLQSKLDQKDGKPQQAKARQ
jgi:flagellin-specific chaperone FliS